METTADQQKLAYLFREGDRALEIVATSFDAAMAALPARVAKAYPGANWEAFTYCGTMPDAMPRYVACANTLSENDARKIADLFGEYLPDVRAELKQANEFSERLITQGDLSGNGLGMYSSARRLFFGYLYDLHYMAACDSQQSARHEFQD